MLVEGELGWRYREGLGVAVDDQIAMYWLPIGADKGVPLAQGDLGLMYAEGRATARRRESRELVPQGS